jgi:hypothetical protein
MWDWAREFAGEYWRYAIALFFFYLAIRATIDWVKDIKFYSANVWDFTKSSGINYKQAMGDSTPVPNKSRVIIVAPIMILTCTMGALIFLFA